MSVDRSERCAVALIAENEIRQAIDERLSITSPGSGASREGAVGGWWR